MMSDDGAGRIFREMRRERGWIAVTVCVLLVAADARARGRGGGGYRGSVRHSPSTSSAARSSYSSSAGSYDRSTHSSGYQRSTSGYQRSGSGWSDSGQVYDRQGNQRAEYDRSLSRDGNTVSAERSIETARGGSAEQSRDYTFEDGQVQSVDSQFEARNQYGRSASGQRSADRQDGYWETEGSAQSSSGRRAEWEGVRGPHGGYADVDSRYHGSGGVAYRNTPYGGRVVTTLPSGYRRYYYYGRPYYYYGGYYYRPYYYGGTTYYAYVPPPYGTTVEYYPSGSSTTEVDGETYYVADGVYYEETVDGGAVGYEVVPAPEGATVTTLSAGYARVTVGGRRYYYHRNTFYRGVGGYAVVSEPEGVVTVPELPEGYDVVEVGGAAYFQVGDDHYLPYLRPSGEESYLLVDAPEPAPAAEAAPRGVVGARSGYIDTTLTVAVGTALKVRLASAVDAAAVAEGDSIRAYLDEELRVGSVVAVPRGATVHGRVVATSGGRELVLELTAVEVHGEPTAIRTASFAAVGTDDAGEPASADLGATLSAIADAGAGAGDSAGAAVVLPAQSLLTFEVVEPFRVPVRITV